MVSVCLRPRGIISADPSSLYPWALLLQIIIVDLILLPSLLLAPLQWKVGQKLKIHRGRLSEWPQSLTVPLVRFLSCVWTQTCRETMYTILRSHWRIRLLLYSNVNFMPMWPLLPVIEKSKTGEGGERQTGGRKGSGRKYTATQNKNHVSLASVQWWLWLLAICKCFPKHHLWKPFHLIYRHSYSPQHRSTGRNAKKKNSISTSLVFPLPPFLLLSRLSPLHVCVG